MWYVVIYASEENEKQIENDSPIIYPNTTDGKKNEKEEVLTKRIKHRWESWKLLNISVLNQLTNGSYYLISQSYTFYYKVFTIYIYINS